MSVLRSSFSTNVNSAPVSFLGRQVAGRVVLARVIASVPIGCSIGLGDWTAESTFEEAVQAADRAMYADKGRKNR